MNRGPGRRVVGLLAACLLAVLGLTACSGDEPSPKPTSSVQPAETSTPEITVTPPALLTGQPTAASAVAFVKYFIDVYNYAYASYDTSLLNAISQPSCQSCAAVIAEVKQLHQTRTKVNGGEVIFVNVALPTSKIDRNFVVLAVTSQRPRETSSADGKIARQSGSQKSQTAFGLDWDGGKWLVRGIRVEKPGAPWSG